jgi:hypothetical protein
MQGINTWKEFTDIIRRYFAFLEEDFCFRIIAYQEPKVIYASTLLKVVIFYEIGQRRDLDIRIESAQDSHRNDFSFSPGEFECLHRHDWGAVRATIPPSNVDEFKSILSDEVSRLKNHCNAVLKGDFKDIGRLQYLKNEFEKRFTIEYQQANRKKGYLTIVNELMNQIIREQHWEEI